MLTAEQEQWINTTETHDYASEELFEATGIVYTDKHDLGGIVVYFNNTYLAGFYDYERELGQSIMEELQTI